MGTNRKCDQNGPVPTFKNLSATKKVCMCRFCTHTLVVSMSLAEIHCSSLISRQAYLKTIFAKFCKP